jgi:hypothetical protein
MPQIGEGHPSTRPKFMWPWHPVILNGKYYIIGDEYKEVTKKEYDEFIFRYLAGLTPRGAIQDMIRAQKEKDVKEWWAESSSEPGHHHRVWVDPYDTLRCECYGYRWGHCCHCKYIRNLHHLPYLMRKEKENGLIVRDIIYE